MSAALLPVHQELSAHQVGLADTEQLDLTPAAVTTCTARGDQDCGRRNYIHTAFRLGFFAPLSGCSGLAGLYDVVCVSLPAKVMYLPPQQRYTLAELPVFVQK